MIYHFDEFSLDMAKHELRRDGQPIEMQPLPLRLIGYLVENRERLVDRGELMQRLWAGRVVSDWAVSAAIKAARAAIGDDGTPKRFIKTIHASGLRFVADVKTGDAAEKAAPRTAAAAALRLLVLPFEDRSAGAAYNYFAEGLTDDIIHALRDLKDVEVMSRHASRSTSGLNASPATVFADRFGASHILSASVGRDGDRFRIHASLVETGSDSELWTDRFDGAGNSIFDVQDQICRKIAAGLKQQMDFVQRKPGTDNPQAYDACLQGRMAYFLYSPAHLKQAAEKFRAAIDIDPGYADAHAYLAYCMTTAHVFAWPGGEGGLSSALALADRAIALDRSSELAHSRRGWALGFSGQIEAAIASFEEAVRLNASNAEVWHSYGETLNRFARPDEALTHLENAFRLDRFVPPSWDFARGHSHLLRKDFEAARKVFETVLERVPGFVPCRVQLVRLCVETDDLEQARRHVAIIAEKAPMFTVATAGRMFPYPVSSERMRLLEALRSSGMRDG